MRPDRISATAGELAGKSGVFYGCHDDGRTNIPGFALFMTKNNNFAIS